MNIHYELTICLKTIHDILSPYTFLATLRFVEQITHSQTENPYIYCLSHHQAIQSEFLGQDFMNNLPTRNLINPLRLGIIPNKTYAYQNEVQKDCFGYAVIMTTYV